MKKIFFIAFVLLFVVSGMYCNYILAQEGPPHGGQFEGQPPGPPPGNPGEGRPPGCHGEGQPPGPPKELTEEQEAEVIAFGKQYLPTKFEQIMEIKEEDPMQYKKILADSYPLMLHLKKLQNKDKTMFDLIIQKEELDAQSIKLAREYNEAGDEATKSRIESELLDVVGRLFDVRQEEEKAKADKMEEELKKIREALAEKDKNRNAIIQNRIDELTGKNKYLQW